MNTPLRSRPRRLRPVLGVPTHRPAPTGRRAPARAALPIAVLTLALAAGGCSGDGSDRTPSSGGTETATTTSVAGPAPLATRAEVGAVVGRLPGTRRKAVRREVTEVLDRWWDTAYVRGDYPRSDFRSFPGFTPGASRRARFDRDLMSNADIGERVGSVTPLMRRARLDLLAVDRRVRSVTARFDLRLRVVLRDRAGDEETGATGTTRRLQVRGRVFLTRRPAGWRIFGYDVTKGWLS